MTVATKHEYVYSFLDPRVQRNGLVAAYVFGIAAAIVVIFCIVKGLVHFRKWVTESKMGRKGKFAHGRRGVRVVEPKVY